MLCFKQAVLAAGPVLTGCLCWLARRSSSSDTHILEVHGATMRVFGVTVSNMLLWGPGVDSSCKGLWVHGTADTLTLYNLAVNNCGVGMHLEGLGGESGVS
jgi:hypothetical protein